MSARTFRDFIAGLLGRAQTIETVIPGPFEVSRDNVASLVALLDQRVSSQNEATLVQFTARVVYNDNSSVLLNSLEEFLAYNEVKPLIATGLHLSWSYIIKFRNKSVPEKQVIQISFDTAGRAIELRGAGSVQLVYSDTKPISLRIEHTDRTWGADIEALLRGHLELLQRPVGVLRAFANKWSGWIGLCTGSASLSLTLLATYRIADAFAASQMEKAAAIKSAGGPVSVEAMAKQLEFLINLIASGTWTRFSLFAAVLLLILMLACGGVAILVSEKAHVPVPSFLLLTSRSEQHKQAELDRMRRSWIELGLSFVGAMLLGIASNTAFYLAIRFLGLPS